MKPRDKAPLGGELIIPILAIAFTLYYFSTIWNSPWTAQVSAFIVGGVLIAVCCLFAIRCGLRLRRGEATLGVGNLVDAEDWRTGRIGLFAATLGYCVLIDSLGFTLTTFLFLLAGMAALSKFRNLKLIAAIAAAISLAGWAAFIWAFDTRFPRGPFETAMKALLS